MTPSAQHGRMAAAVVSATALAAVVATVVALVVSPLPARADSAQAYCVLSRHDHTAPLERGPCQWSQRQGNVNILFRHWAFAFPSDEDGRTYSRLNREGPEAGPVFTREGQYTLSVYWRKPARDPGGQ